MGHLRKELMLNEVKRVGPWSCRINVLMLRDTRNLESCLSKCTKKRPCKHTRRWRPPTSQERRPQNERSYTSQPPELWETNFCCVSSPVSVFCYGSPRRLRRILAVLCSHSLPCPFCHLLPKPTAGELSDLELAGLPCWLCSTCAFPSTVYPPELCPESPRQLVSVLQPLLQRHFALNGISLWQVCQPVPRASPTTHGV